MNYIFSSRLLQMASGAPRPEGVSDQELRNELATELFALEISGRPFSQIDFSLTEAKLLLTEATRGKKPKTKFS